MNTATTTGGSLKDKYEYSTNGEGKNKYKKTTL